MKEDSSSLPKRKLKDVESARSLWKRFKDDNDLRDKNAQLVRAQINGARPYKQETLDTLGQGYRANFNSGNAKADRDRASAPFWDIINAGPTTLSVKITPDGESTHMRLESQAKIFEEEFDGFLRRWGAGFSTNMRKMIDEYVDYGIGMPFFEDKDDPKWRNVRFQDFLAPNGTPGDVSAWSIVGVRRTLSFTELWEKVRSGDDSDKAAYRGWDIGQVRRLIAARVKELDKDSGQYSGDAAADNTWSQFQDKVEQNDIFYCESSESIDCVFLFVKQWDGRIALYVFPEDFSAYNTGGESSSTTYGESERFLFADHQFAEEWTQVFTPMLWEVGNGNLHSIRGFAARNYDFSIVINRLMCTALDQAAFNGSLNLRVPKGRSGAKAIHAHGAVNFFEEGVEPLPSVQTRPDYTLGILDAIKRGQAENNSQYRDTQNIGETETATQAKIMAGYEQQLYKANMSLFITQWEYLIREMVRRLRFGQSECSRTFRDRLEQRNFNMNLLKKSVNWEIASGAGSSLMSSAMRVVTWQQLLSIINDPRVNGELILEQYCISMLGQELGRKAMASSSSDNKKSETRQAMMENAHMAEGVPMEVAAGDDHVAHAAIHLSTAQNIVQQFMQTQQVDPSRLPLLINGLPHIEAHLQYLKADTLSKNTHKQLSDLYAEIKRVADGMLSKYQEDNAQPSQQNVPPQAIQQQQQQPQAQARQ